MKELPMQRVSMILAACCLFCGRGQTIAVEKEPLSAADVAASVESFRKDKPYVAVVVGIVDGQGSRLQAFGQVEPWVGFHERLGRADLGDDPLESGGGRLVGAHGLVVHSLPKVERHVAEDHPVDLFLLDGHGRARRMGRPPLLRVCGQKSIWNDLGGFSGMLIFFRSCFDFLR